MDIKDHHLTWDGNKLFIEESPEPVFFFNKI